MTVLDVPCYPNCQLPTFTFASPHTVTLPENTFIGTLVTTVSATTPQSVNVLTYQISANSFFASSFAIDNQGRVTTAGDILLWDIEQRASISVDILAVGDGIPSTPLTLIVNLSNVNDVPPIFQSAQYTASFEENRTGNVIQTTAVDQDSASAALFYSLSDRTGLGLQLDIDSSTGMVSATTPFDYDPPASDRLATATINANNGLFSANSSLLVRTILDKRWDVAS
jgi:hypothetical protein